METPMAGGPMVPQGGKWHSWAPSTHLLIWVAQDASPGMTKQLASQRGLRGGTRVMDGANSEQN